MADDGQFLDAAGLTVQPVGGLRETGDPWMPFELVDADGGVVAPVAAYLRDVQACGRSEATLRSYGMDLLRWFRFCWASGLEWDQVTRSEAADFCRWLTVAGKPGSAGVTRRRRRRTARRSCGTFTASISSRGRARW